MINSTLHDSPNGSDEESIKRGFISQTIKSSSIQCTNFSVQKQYVSKPLVTEQWNVQSASPPSLIAENIKSSSIYCTKWLAMLYSDITYRTVGEESVRE